MSFTTIIPYPPIKTTLTSGTLPYTTALPPGFEPVYVSDDFRQEPDVIYRTQGQPHRGIDAAVDSVLVKRALDDQMRELLKEVKFEGEEKDMRKRSTRENVPRSIYWFAPADVFCLTVHPMNGRKLPIWSLCTSIIDEPHLQTLINRITSMIPFLHYGFGDEQRKTIADHHQGQVPPFYWRSSIACTRCLKADRPCYHASTPPPAPNRILLRCADCVRDGIPCFYAVETSVVTGHEMIGPIPAQSSCVTYPDGKTYVTDPVHSCSKSFTVYAVWHHQLPIAFSFKSIMRWNEVEEALRFNADSLYRDTVEEPISRFTANIHGARPGGVLILLRVSSQIGGHPHVLVNDMSPPRTLFDHPLLRPLPGVPATVPRFPDHPDIVLPPQQHPSIPPSQPMQPHTRGFFGSGQPMVPGSHTEVPAGAWSRADQSQVGLGTVATAPPMRANWQGGMEGNTRGGSGGAMSVMNQTGGITDEGRMIAAPVPRYLNIGSKHQRSESDALEESRGMMKKSPVPSIRQEGSSGNVTSEGGALLDARTKDLALRSLAELPLGDMIAGTAKMTRATVELVWTAFVYFHVEELWKTAVGKRTAGVPIPEPIPEPTGKSTAASCASQSRIYTMFLVAGYAFSIGAATSSTDPATGIEQTHQLYPPSAALRLTNQPFSTALYWRIKIAYTLTGRINRNRCRLVAGPPIGLPPPLLPQQLDAFLAKELSGDSVRYEADTDSKRTAYCGVLTRSEHEVDTYVVFYIHDDVPIIIVDMVPARLNDASTLDSRKEWYMNNLGFTISREHRAHLLKTMTILHLIAVPNTDYTYSLCLLWIQLLVTQPDETRGGPMKHHVNRYFVAESTPKRDGSNIDDTDGGGEGESSEQVIQVSEDWCAELRKRQWDMCSGVTLRDLALVQRYFCQNGASSQK